jgi:hypothetical protein
MRIPFLIKYGCRIIEYVCFKFGIDARRKIDYHRSVFGTTGEKNMPYIAKEKRQLFDTELQALIEKVKQNTTEENVEGTANYVISTFLAETMIPASGVRYKYINRIIGVLGAITLEFYRRIASGYEDKCIVNNDDIAAYQKVKW